MEADSPAPGGALILAAGSSRRFGSDKRRHRLDHGQPMLITTVTRYATTFDAVSVVLREGDESLARELAGLAAPPRVVFAADAHLGMGHSLAAGVHHVAAGWHWLALALGDMPFVQTATLRLLRRTFQEHGGERMVQPVFRGRPGHPVFFPGRYFPALEALSGDAGARTVLRANPGALARVPLDDPGVVRDLDTPAGA